jgi:hypothetical protein
MHRHMTSAVALVLAVAGSGCRDKSGPGAPKASQDPPPELAAMPAPSAPSGPAANLTTASPFSGEVRLAEGEKPGLPGDTLFLVVRQASPDGKPGPLVAAQRIAAPVTLPHRFEVGSRDSMVPGTPFIGPFIVQAHLDHDGDPMTKADDELYAEFPQPVKGGEQGTVTLLLKKGRP